MCVLGKNKNMRLTNRHKQLLSIFLLSLFIGYYCCISFFFHAHIINGDTIIHSHPAKKDANGLPLHSHSSKGFMTIQMLASIILILTIVSYCLKCLSEIVLEISPGKVRNPITGSFHNLHLLRAPPPVQN